MLRRRLMLALAMLSIIPETGIAQSPDDPLHAVRFLEGVWHGEARSPYGPYEFEATFTATGRWIFARSTVFVPGTDQSTVSSGSVFGYDADGLLVYAFGGDGAQLMRVTADGDEVRFGWEEGKAGQRTRLRRQADGSIHSLGEMFRPSAGDQVLRFESIYRPGPR